MNFKKYKSFAALTILFASAGILTESQSYADAYLGGMIGVGSASGEPTSLNSGLGLGATLGFHLIPGLGVAVTYLHSALQTTIGNQDFGVSQLLAEGNIFSLLFLNGGVHIGEVTESSLGASTTDMGFGAHLGIDIKIIDNISVGAVAYWTYDTESNNKHSLFNVMAPLKYWF